MVLDQASSEVVPVEGGCTQLVSISWWIWHCSCALSSATAEEHQLVGEDDRSGRVGLSTSAQPTGSPVVDVKLSTRRCLIIDDGSSTPRRRTSAAWWTSDYEVDAEDAVSAAMMMLLMMMMSMSNYRRVCAGSATRTELPGKFPSRRRGPNSWLDFREQ